MRLAFLTQSDAQARSAELYAAMAGRLEPNTVRWAVPSQDADGKWYVPVDARCKDVLSDAECAVFPEWQPIAR